MSYGLSLIALWFIYIDAFLERKYFAYLTKDERICCKGKHNCCHDMFPVITNYRWDMKFETWNCCKYCCRNNILVCTCKCCQCCTCFDMDQEHEIGGGNDHDNGNGRVVALEVNSANVDKDNE